MKIEFIDLKAQREYIGDRMDTAILAAVNEGKYIHGPQVREFEGKLAEFCGAKHAIGCANGTDALELCLMALDLRPGEAVICPSFTFAATAEVVAGLGATPVFAEIDEATFNIDPKGLEAALETAKREGLKVRALIAVDLFGQPSDYEPIEAFCRANGIVLIADSAQGFGSRYRGRVAGSIGDMATTSFFPAKPLGCYGDGGAILTPNDEYNEVIRSLHVHGKGTDKYDNVRIGVNSRLDTLQAAILLEKIAIFAEEIDKRQVVADRYAAGLAGVVRTPMVLDGCVSTWAQYVVRVPADKRDAMIDGLKAQSVPTAIYYPKPLHEQTAYKNFPVSGNGLPISERAAQQVIALPMHPYLDEATQDYIIDAVRAVATELGVAV
ncbi:aminotransferase DegT [Hoeflea sp. BAL378]|uniref:DegT/DnrJ/EryC1/StrS family aminotransferase n=1 Tax=Hoeflea sp. BAL378 TaxID=1547437 RepID=UPI000513A6D4|nr:DegT/DnrJ/EryC1/StrS family aminotransferase [Hoeflea sp. BAL378]KGF67315.1 aminotransferase DegT [Hoeflea sp. BAL378]